MVITGEKSDIKKYTKAVAVLEELTQERVRFAEMLRIFADDFIATGSMAHRWKFMETSVEYKNILNAIEKQKNLIEYLSRHIKITE